MREDLVTTATVPQEWQEPPEVIAHDLKHVRVIEWNWRIAIHDHKIHPFLFHRSGRGAHPFSQD